MEIFLCPDLLLQCRDSFPQLPGMLVIDQSLQVFFGEVSSLRRDDFTQVRLFPMDSPQAMTDWVEVQWPDTLVLIWNNAEAPSQLRDP